MKFISFITSTMLIVLISQHSMGLPLTSTIVGETCSEGFEMLNGKCMPIQSSTIGVEAETVTNFTEIITRALPEEDHTTEANSPKISKHCPPGSQYLEDGKCGPVEPVVITKLNDDSTISSILPATATEYEPMVHPDHEPTTSSILPATATEYEPMVPPKDESTTSSILPATATEYEPMLHPEDESTTSSILPATATEYEPMVPSEGESTTEVYNPRISKRCPTGSKYLKNGKCGPVKSLAIKEFDDESTATVELEPTVFSETTEINHELTTGLNDDERTGGVDNPQGCPKGTEVDEQGACQEIQGANTDKMTTEPSFPVNPTCPGGYKKFNGKCVYTETITSSDDLQPKTGDIETLTDEVVSTSDDGTCPDGTAFIASGYCKKLNRPTPANVPMDSDGRCRANYELVDEICVYKGNKIPSDLGLLPSTISMPLRPKVDEEQIEVNTENLFQSTATVTDY